MAIIKCKMCGGDLIITEGSSVCECEYCGSKQTVPIADNEKKLTLFTRAGRLLRNCEFDKASGVFETIVADFPEEAEAYWGLVLCKYGIEYVDDPGTGKKVPTCHRSSFDSVEDDTNFEQACENADAIARRVYRDEARQIEELRKNIIEVSGKEDPYDIFISYKETNENGERTLDSVIAQDIYNELTEKGYRVFFSRISLESKLGTEYEPYIFAALNSAKVMLVVGTDYDNFDAVWVKNEWSRFLKLIASGQKKTLIPVFKNMDAYDMPKEFAKLAAQDMGKVGAMQDLLRGVEKLIDKQKPSSVSTTIVHQSGGPNVSSLLKRGYMMLNSGDMEAAEEYFNRVLDIDAECAEAYLGLAIREMCCTDLEDLMETLLSRRRSRVNKNLLVEDASHIDRMCEQYQIKNFLSAEDIRKQYEYDLSYDNIFDIEKKCQEEVLREFDNDTNISYANKFAKGETKEKLITFRAELMAALQKNVEDAEMQDYIAQKNAQEKYDDFLKSTDQRVEKLYQDASDRREKLYQDACKRQGLTFDEYRMKGVISDFQKIQDYKDSEDRIDQCRRTIDENRERKRNENIKLAAKKRRKTIVAILCTILTVVAIFVITKVIIPGNRYQEAVQLELAGDKPHAAMMYYQAGKYRDAREKSFSLWREITPQYTIAGDLWPVFAISSSGDVLQAGSASYSGGYGVSKWKNLYSIVRGEDRGYSGFDFFFGLQKSGNVVCSSSSISDDYDKWSDIVAIAAGKNVVMGLKADGRVIVNGANSYLNGWSDIVAISAGGAYDLSSKNDLSHIVGLRADGTVVASGSSKYGQTDVSGWTDIVAIAAGAFHTVGLKSDGTVVVTGAENTEHDYSKVKDVSDWTNVVAIAAGQYHTLGLRSDGTVLATGRNPNGQCDVDDWYDVCEIVAGTLSSYGVRSDGSVVCTGSGGTPESNKAKSTLATWDNVQVPRRSKGT